MAILLNIGQLHKGRVRLEGQIPAKELDLESADELVHVTLPITYKLEAEYCGNSMIVSGEVCVAAECECARCLKRYRHTIELNPWNLSVSFEGEDKATIISDSVDLTPYMREDILLGFPQRPLCEAGCSGLTTGAKTYVPDREKRVRSDSPDENVSSAWSELNRLKF